MTTQKNTIISEFKTTGAANVEKATDRIGKAQTRLGQASASAGRSFSAQAAGLGGVVGIYAAAAANVFALSAAFTALNRAAQFETILRGTQQLAGAVGTSANTVVKRLQDITGGQLSVVQAAEAANLALSAGFNTDQIENLGKVAFKASRTLGRNLPDAIERVFRGAIKLEPELLDELGIFTRLDPAAEAYAAKLNKSANSLTSFERRQAFATAVTRDGLAAFSDVSIATDDATASFQRLAAQFADLAIITGNLIAKALAPFADFLGANLGNKLILLGGIGALVFGKLKDVVFTFATAGLSALSNSLVNATEKLTTFGGKFKEIGPQMQEAAQAFAGGGALPGAGRGVGADLKRTLESGKLSTQQALEFQKQIPALLERELLVRGQLQEDLDKGVITQEKFDDAVGKSQKRTDGLEKSQTVVNARLKAAGPLANALAGGLNLAAAGMQKLATFSATVLSYLGPLLGLVSVIQLLGSLFGFDAIGFVTEKFREFGRASREAEEGLKGFGQAAANLNAGPLEDLRNQLNLSREDFADVIEIAAKLKDEGGVIGGVGFIKPGDVDKTKRALEFLNEELEKAQKSVAEGDIRFWLDFEKRVRNLNLQIAALEASISGVELPSQKVGRAIVQFAQQGEKEIDLLQQAAARGFLGELGDDAKTLELRFNGLSLAIAGSGGNIDNLDKGVKSIAAQFLDTALKVEKFQEAFSKGLISADRAAKDVGVLNSLLGDLQSQVQSLPESPFKVELLEFINATLEDTVDIVDKLNDRFQTLEKFGTGLRKTFSAELGLADSALFTGDVSLTGAIAKDAGERIENISQVVGSVFEQASAIESKFGDFGILDRDALNADEKAVIDLRDTLVKGYLGSIIKTAAEQEKLTKKLKDQIKISEAQEEVAGRNLLVTQANTKLTEMQAKAKIDAAQREFDVLQKNRDLTKEGIQLIQAENSLALARLDIKKQELEVKLEELEASQKLASTEQDIINAKARAREASNLRSAENALSTAEMRGISTQKELLALRIRVAETEYTNTLNDIDRREAIARQEKADQSDVLAQRSIILEQERSINEARITNELQILRLQNQARIEQEKIEAANRSDQEQIFVQRREIADKTRAAAVASAEAAKLQRDLSLNAQIEQLQLINKQADVFNKFITNFSGLIAAFAKTASEFTGKEISFDFTASNIKADVKENIARLNKLLVLSGSLYEIQSDSADSQRTATLAQIDADEKLLSIQGKTSTETSKILTEIFEANQNSLLEELDALNSTSAEKQRILGIEQKQLEQNLLLKLEELGIERQAAEAMLKSARDEANYRLSEQARLDAAYAAAKNIVEDYVTNGLMELNNALIEGNFTFKDLARGFRDMLQSMLKEIQAAVFRKTIAEPIATSVASFLPKLFAGGGAVHLAGGGSMKRDRVAAMLEPGEFVIRKEAAKKLGMSKLQELNAGTTDDPLARLIAMFGGSKVSYKVGGGSLGFGGATGDLAARGVDVSNRGNFGGGNFSGGGGDPVTGMISPGINKFGNPNYGAVYAAKTLSQKIAADPEGYKQAGDAYKAVQASMERGKKGKDLEAIAQKAVNPKGFFSAVTSVASQKVQNLFTPKGFGMGLLGKMDPTPISAAIGVGTFMSDVAEEMGLPVGPADTGENNSKAAGGIVRMAGGGSVAARDRVPALLEPGEFVIRRPMAKAIGGAALNQMNATGRPPQISVNMTNQGMPKDVAVAPPRMNGDKIILDIITRDLRNNGAIKKTLRKGK